MKKTFSLFFALSKTPGRLIPLLYKPGIIDLIVLGLFIFGGPYVS